MGSRIFTPAGAAGAGWLVLRDSGDLLDQCDDLDPADEARMQALGDDLDTLMAECEKRFTDTLASVIRHDNEEESARDCIAKGEALLREVARDVIACDTTSEVIVQKAMRALAMVEGGC